jgi:hypothetical protein
VLELISDGWPVKLSDLKTMLERSTDGSERAHDSALAG